MIKTEVTWPLNIDKDQSLFDKLDQMVSDNKTDGLLFSEIVSADEIKSERVWSTQEAAQEWIDFVLTLNPISAKILYVDES